MKFCDLQSITAASFLKHRNLIILTIFFWVCSAGSARAQLVLNEMSQGQSGTKEYVELVVVGTKTCTDSTADIRGWIIDDNNGWLGTGTGQGIAQGCMRFSSSPTWAKVPYGSVILVYNDGDKNSSIVLPDDPTDADHDYIYIVPASSAELENNSSTPASPSASNYTYPTTGFNAGGSWGRMGLANGGDAVIIVSPANLSAAYFSLGYGGISNSGNATIYKSTSGTAKCYYLSDNQYSTAASWIAGASPTNETPGTFNTTANGNWITSMRQFSNTTVARDTTRLSGCSNVVHGGITYTSSIILTDTVKAAGGCDSVYHITDISIQPLSNITITASGPATFCAGDSVILSAPVVSSLRNNALDLTGTGKYVYPGNLPSFYDNFTFEMWVNPSATIVLAPEATSGTGGTSGERYALYPTWGGSNNSINGPTNPDAGAGLSVGTNGIAVYEHGASYLTPLLVWSGTVSGWTHIAVVYINKQPSLYINGVFVKTGLTSLKNRVYPSLGQWAGNLYNLSGGIGGGNYGYFNGQLDEFRLWDMALSPASILANYNKIIQPLPVSNLYAYYRFDEGTGNSTADLSGNGLTGTLINNPAWMVPSTAPITGYGNSDYSYLWTPGNDTNSAITVRTPGTYTVTVTNSSGCTGMASQTVQTITAVSHDTTLTGCNSIVHNGITYTSSVTLSDTLRSTGGCDSIYSNTSIIVQSITPVNETETLNGCGSVVYNGTTYQSSTTIQDTLRSSGGCDSIFVTANIRVDAASTVNVTDSFYQGQSYTLPSGMSVNTPGIYTSTLTKANGCDSIIYTTLLLLNDNCLLNPPNIFTPNGDGYHDVWKIFSEACFKKCRVSVYNRYGSLVYSSGNYNNDWNGKYKNGPLPDATYYYVIEVIRNNGRTQRLIGNVTIMR